MPRADSDRNLLFGILAVQMDFIARDALIAALHAWVLEKTKPLGQILVEQHALAEDERGVLEALVEKHLRKHGDDPAQSLAAVRPSGPVRGDLEQITDTDVQASIACTTVDQFAPDGRAPADDPFATLPPPIGDPTAPAARFRKLRAHARGNLGEVFVALDEELRREVALKEIQTDHADRPESRSRFVREAEVTGGLEHPGIVPVYSLGHHPDGRPYYAMRFIQGDSLKEAIEKFHQADVPGRDPGERTLALRELLGRLIAVCDAMTYAHSRGILHRDLKPGNIMLGKFGETLVVDWGLARAGERPDVLVPMGERTLRPTLDEGAQETAPGKAMGTPAFMSPEQAIGDLTRLGPASDVYSLGATLYTLLTGRVAFSGRDLDDLLEKVQRGEFPLPRSVLPGIPRALEAICRKAMALKPEDRYGTARDLADDLKRWLADEPISAFPDPWRALAGRWARRHKPAVAGIAALLITTTVALAIGIAWIGAERAIAITERDRADENTRLASTERAKAVVERQRADHNAKLASERFKLAFVAYVRLVSTVQERLASPPAMHKLREDLLTTAVTGLERLVESADWAADVNRTMASAHRQLGDIALQLGETTRALQHYERGFRIAEALAKADPDNAQAQTDVVASCGNLGLLEQKETHPKEAIGWFERGLTILRRLESEGKLKDQPQFAEWRRSLEKAIAECREAIEK